MGFKDGTANPNPDDTALMDQVVWIGRDQDEPVVGRRRELHGRAADPDVRRALGPDRAARAGEDHRPDEADRAPLGADREEDLPVYDGDPDGARIPLDAHIRQGEPANVRARNAA